MLLTNFTYITLIMVALTNRPTCIYLDKTNQCVLVVKPWINIQLFIDPLEAE